MYKRQREQCLCIFFVVFGGKGAEGEEIIASRFPAIVCDGESQLYIFNVGAVSYTHLDVYKRQEHLSILRDNHAVLFPRLVMGLIGIKKIIKVFYLKFFYGK